MTEAGIQTLLNLRGNNGTFVTSNTLLKLMLIAICRADFYAVFLDHKYKIWHSAWSES